MDNFRWWRSVSVLFIFHSIKSRMVLTIILLGVAAALVFVVYNTTGFRASRLITAYEKDPEAVGGVKIANPLNESIFPPEIIAPFFRWSDSCVSCDRWLVFIRFRGAHKSMGFFVGKRQWRPAIGKWEKIKRRSLGKNARVIIAGFNHSTPGRVLSAAEISFSTSRDSVNDPVFYREVNLPFGEAIKDPSHIRWRFGAISQEHQPRTVLSNLPVCGNCHSFSADGKTLGMDVDYANDKGSYVLTKVGLTMSLATSDIINWSDFRRKDNKPTFGLLSQVSPDGRHVVSTVKDLSVFLPRPDLTISQLFFPIQGILVIYSREKKTFTALPGADDTNFVQSNPAWSPDGKYIVFARSNVYRLPRRYSFQVVPSEKDSRDFLEKKTLFKFDMYRIPFNEGKGGRAEPLRGASHNGMSNYFAKYSPDGKWIVFCKANSFMLLQPDSKLYIMPAEGGEPRLMRCNTSLLNSWHSWSSNSRWLIFSSKTNTPYTQLFITHIDENGMDAAPVLLEHFTLPDRAANIPEFVNTAPGAIHTINERFIDDYSIWRAGKAFERGKDFHGAAEKFKEALTLNPKNIRAHLSLGNVLEAQGNVDEAISRYSEALRLDSTVETLVTLANTLRAKRKYGEALDLYEKALRQSPKDPFALYNIALTLYESGSYTDALQYFVKAKEVEPNDVGVWYGLANASRKVGKIEEAAAYLRKAITLAPGDAALYAMLGDALFTLKRYAEAEKNVRTALKIEPFNADYLVLHARLLQRKNDIDGAISVYRRALQFRPDYFEARDSLESILRRKEETNNRGRAHETVAGSNGLR